MVDTITLQFNLSWKANYFLLRLIKEKKIKGFSYIPKNYAKKGVNSYCAKVAPFGIYYNNTYGYLNVTIKPILILNHQAENGDYTYIEESAKKVVFEKLGIPKEFFKSITLNRIDYNIDYRISNEVERQIIYNLMRENV